MLTKLTIDDLQMLGKVVFCRVDFNVPLDANQQITDDTRIRAAIPTIEAMRKAGARIVLASHLGRPKNGPEPKFSLAPAATRLGELLGTSVVMAPDCIGPGVLDRIADLKDGDILMLENVRFHAGETKNNPEFAAELAKGCDLYVNDAFGAAHRAHASTEGVARLLSKAAAGYLMEKEIRYLGNAVSNPQRPLVAIIGGAKVSDKIAVIENLLTKVDTLIIGGGMAYTFLRAQGIQTGASLVEEDRIDLAKSLLKLAEERGVALLLPEDHRAAAAFAADAESKLCGKGDIPAGWMGLDIGPATIATYCAAIAGAGTVIWNGPMGVFEFPAFAEGTFSLASALADSNAISIIGGGDSVAAVNKSGLNDRMSHISTGGGASLEFLEGKELPGLTALTDK